MQKNHWNTKTLTFLALLIALQIILGDIFSITISAANKVSLGPVAGIMAGMWLGPVAGFLCGTVADLVGFFTAPQPYPFNPFITLAAGVWGLVPGLMRNLFANKSKLMKSVFIVISIVISSIIGSFILTTLGLVLMSGLDFFKIYWARILQMIVNIPVYSVITCLLYFSPLTKMVTDSNFSIKRN